MGQIRTKPRSRFLVPVGQTQPAGREVCAVSGASSLGGSCLSLVCVSIFKPEPVSVCRFVKRALECDVMSEDATLLSARLYDHN